jgi:hypothetical protein
MTDCVCFVYANIKGECKPVGTAFFLAIPISDTHDAIALVTALHVVAKIQQRSDDGKTFVRVNTKDGGFQMLAVNTDAWQKPDQSTEIVDVCFCAWPFPWEESDYDIRYFSAKQVATKDVMKDRRICVGNEVAFAGLFVNHHGQKRNEPIVRFGNISAIPAELVSIKYGDIEAYLIESRSVGGLSGSPVFVDPGQFRIADDGASREWRSTGEPGGYLLGVMHGHWEAPKEAAEIDAKEAEAAEVDAKEAEEADSPEAAEEDYFGIAKEYINMGIAVVTPIDKVLKLIEESLWGQRLREAAKHLTGAEDAGVILVTDLSTGALLAKGTQQRIRGSAAHGTSSSGRRPRNRNRLADSSSQASSAASSARPGERQSAAGVGLSS